MKRTTSRKIIIAAVVALVAAPFPSAAAKTDVVVFQDGNSLTGEIKELNRGQLKFKTDTTGTIKIKWLDVARLEGVETFEIDLVSGERLFGSLATSPEPGQLLVIGDEGAIPVLIPSVVYITAVESSFWKRLDGSISLGFNFTESDERSQLSLSTDTSYLTPKLVRSLSFNIFQTSQPGVRETDRYDLGFEVGRFLRKPKRLLIGVAQIEGNEELGLDRRALLSGAAGWRVIQTSSTYLTLMLGLAVSREDLAGPEPSQDNVEGLLGLGFQHFKFDDPERDIDIKLAVFPGLSDSDRWRAEFEASIRWEIVNDLTFGLSVNESFDSNPVSEGAEKTDLSVITTVGWTY